MTMKTTIVLVCLLSATAAFGQYYSVGTAPIESTYNPPEHQSRAVSHSMSAEQNLLGVNSLTSAQGEMPLWEAPALSHEVPLGDIARTFKKEHATAKKARLILDK
jgi:hypothetical protein